MSTDFLPYRTIPLERSVELRFRQIEDRLSELFGRQAEDVAVEQQSFGIAQSVFTPPGIPGVTDVLSGDVSGEISANTVDSIQDIPFLMGTPAAGDLLILDASGIFRPSKDLIGTAYTVEGQLIFPNDPAASTTLPRIELGSALVSGAAGGTGIGANYSSGFTGDFADFQQNGALKFKVASDGAAVAHSLLISFDNTRRTGASIELCPDPLSQSTFDFIGKAAFGPDLCVAEMNYFVLNTAYSNAAQLKATLGLEADFSSGGVLTYPWFSLINQVTETYQILCDLNTEQMVIGDYLDAWDGSGLGTAQTWIANHTNATRVALRVLGHSTQSADILQVNDRDEGAYWAVDATGNERFYRKTSTTNERSAASTVVSWADSTDATRKARMVANVYDATAAREGWRIESDGTYGLMAIGDGVSTNTHLTITAAADTLTPLALHRFSATQSANLLEARDQTGAAMSGIGPAGGFLGPSGSVSLPGFRFFSDPDNGLYLPTTNALGFVTAGAEAARFNANGNLVLASTKRIYAYSGLDEASFPTFFYAFRADVTGSISVNQEAFHVDAFANHTNAASTRVLYGLRLQAGFSSTTPSSSLNAVVGGSFVGSFLGTASGRTCTTIQGGEFIAQATQTGTGATTTALVAGNFSCDYSGQNLTITRSTQVQIQTPNAPGAGTTVANNWGIRIQDMAGRGTTQNAAIVINNQTTGSNNYSFLSEGGKVKLQAGSAGNIILTLQGAALQTGDQLQVLDSSSNILATISAAGAGMFLPRDAATTTVTLALTLGHNSSATVAAGFGNELRVQLQSSTTVNRDAAGLVTTWATATDATRKARSVYNIYDTAAREAFRVEADGSNPMIGFLGASAIVRPGATTDLRVALINLGLYTTGGATPLDLNGGALTAGSLTLADGGNIVVGTGTGTKIGTSTSQKLGFFNAAPVVRPAAYTPSNVTTDRSYDANSTTLDEIADVLGSLIADLQSLGLIG